jgi:hypothetical protein
MGKIGMHSVEEFQMKMGTTHFKHGSIKMP